MWEEGPSGEELSPSDCPVAPSVVCFVDGYVMVPATVSSHTPGQVVLGCVRKQAEQADKQCSSMVSALLRLESLP